MSTRTLMCAVFATAAVAACGTASPASQRAAAPSPAATTSAPVESASPSASPVTPSPSPSASPVAAPAPRPATIAVTFTGLRSGTYPVHIHSICNGSQAFHIVVVQSLVSMGGTGTIGVPSGYFGRGLCLIVYGSPALSTVIATRRI